MDYNRHKHHIVINKNNKDNKNNNNNKDNINIKLDIIINFNNKQLIHLEEHYIYSNII